MAGFDESQIENILMACNQNVEAIASTFSQVFDIPVQLESGESGVWEAERLPKEFRGSGIVALFFIGDQAAGCFVPDGILPKWYLSPNESQKARLQTLPMEWSMTIFPADIEIEEYRTQVSTSLQGELQRMGPSETAAFQEMKITQTGGESYPMFLIWPLLSAKKDGTTSSQSQTESPPPAPPPQQSISQVAAAPVLDPFGRLRNLPVTVSVRLAEKRISVSQLRQLGHGTLVAFNKPCEDLLDLYVNNSLYGRGEVVKIGEKFGLKINEINSRQERQTRVIID